MSCLALVIYLFLESASEMGRCPFVVLEASVALFPASPVKDELFHLFKADLGPEAGRVFLG